MSIDIAPFIGKLSEIFRASDALYVNSQNHYVTAGGEPFSCAGCPENCCTTVFYHYTLIEYFFLAEGLSQITDPVMAEAIAQRSQEYYLEIVRNPFKTDSLRIMCPLNFDGKCVVYENRPLICRVHGVPSSLNQPGKAAQRWDGCKRFLEFHGGKDFPVAIDRTPFYTQIAALEAQLRKEMVYFQKYKKTIAEMIIDFIRDEPFLSPTPAPPTCAAPTCHNKACQTPGQRQDT